MGAVGDPQSILNEVSNLRQKYEECRASKEDVHKKDLLIEINRKNGVIKSLEQIMLLRDRSYRETNARNKNLIAQLHTQNVTKAEREMLKKALVSAKGELALAQKELKGGSSSIVKIREELSATKVTLAKLQATPSRVQPTEKIVTKVVESAPKIIEKIVYKDKPVAKIIEKVVYRDRPVEKGKVVEKVVYKDRLIEKEKIVEKVVYRDRPIEKIIEKIVYKDRPVEKIVTKTVIVEKPIVDENSRGKMDKLALDLEREKTLNLKLTSDLAKTTAKRKVSIDLPAVPPIQSITKHSAAKTIVAPAIKKVPETVGNPSNNFKKSSGVYRMASNASIYNAPNGRATDTWEAHRSFTGNSAANGWIHITGYFVNRVFQGVGEGENLWVKESDAIPR